MRYLTCSVIAIAGLCGCSVTPMTSTPSANETCRIAGTSDDQSSGLRTLIENARNAGILAEDVLTDAVTACEVCVDPDVDCDATLCESCFSAIVNEVFAQQN